MRIVDRKTFLSLPAGTLFYKYQPCILSDFAIKDETIRQMSPGDAGDYRYVPLDQIWVESPTTSDYHTPYLEMAEKDAEYPIDVECTARDGLFDEDQLFAVLDEQDVRTLIDRLTACLPKSDIACGG